MRKVVGHILISISVYIILYSLYSFIIWELQNPFLWVLDLPNAENLERVVILMSVLIYQFFMRFIAFIITETIKNSKV